MRLCKECNVNPVPESNLKRYNYKCYQCDYAARDKKKVAANEKKQRQHYRGLVLDHYGAKCNYCGSTNELHIDHKHGDGKQHRESIPSGSLNMARIVVREGYPDKYQILCRECNMAKQDKSDQQFREWVAKMNQLLNGE